MKNKCYIFRALRGSHSRGLNHALSDIDYIGVYIAPLSFYFGFGGKDAYQNNTKEEDNVEYELKKYLQLCAASNPNVLETLWCPLDRFGLYTGEYLGIREHRNLFASKKVADTFGGYADGQLKRMVSLNKDVLERFELLESYLVAAGIDILQLNPRQNLLDSFIDTVDGIVRVRQVLTEYKEIKSVHFRGGRLGEARKQLIKKYTFDTKNASTCVMLLLQARDFLLTGELPVDQTANKGLLFDIKDGKVSLAELQKLAQSFFF